LRQRHINKLFSDSRELHLRRVAEKHGHKVIGAITGAAAFGLAASAQADLIVLDIEFPDADGRDVLAKLKADARTAHIPVVSGRDGKETTPTAGSRSTWVPRTMSKRATHST